MEFFKNIIIGGKIPHFRVIRRIALVLSFSPILLYWLTDISFVKFGTYGWRLLIVIMLIRPLADIFPDIKILRSLVSLRKEAGILSGLFILIHSYVFFAQRDQLIFTAIFDAKYWNWDSAITWGLMGFITVIPLLLTSNNFSIKILRNQWKNIQRLVYPLFFFSAVHIVLINREQMLKILVPVVIVLILWFLAHFRIKVKKNVKQ